MIDYEKLKLAHELAEKLPNNCGIEVSFFKLGNPRFFYTGNPYEESICFTNLDDLITKIKELLESSNRPDSKYKVGQEVWFLSGTGIKKYTISSLHWCDDLQNYRLNLINSKGRTSVNQDDVYASKMDLITYHARYWINLLREERMQNDSQFKVCEHESDGLIYTSYPPKLKCNKCGEFYR